MKSVSEIINYREPLKDSERIKKLDELRSIAESLNVLKLEKATTVKFYDDDIKAKSKVMEELRELVYYGEHKQEELEVVYDNEKMTRTYVLPYSGEKVVEQTDAINIFGS